MIRSWKYGILKALNYWPLIMSIYFVQLFLAGFVALKFANIIKSNLWQSLNFKKLLTGYDHAVLSDFRRVFAEDLQGLNSNIALIFIIYLLFSILLNGGLLASILDKNKSVQNFFRKGLTHYLKIGLVIVISLILLVIWAGITLFPLRNLIQKVMDGVITEPQLLIYLLLGGSAFYLGFCLIFCWSTLARMHVIQGIYSVWKSFQKAFSKVLKRIFGCIGLVSLFVLVQVILILLYLFIEDIIGMKSAPLVVLFLVIQQIFVLIRIGWRVMVYLGIEHYLLEENKVIDTVNN